MAAGLPKEKWPVVNIPEVFTPANFNHHELTEYIKKSASKQIGSDNVIYAEPQLVGEHFSRYGQTNEKVPTALFWLGTVTQEKIDTNNLPGLHSPYYYPEPELTLETGISVTTQTLLDLFNQKK